MMGIISEKKEQLNQQLDDIKVVLNELENLEESCKKTLSNITNNTN